MTKICTRCQRELDISNFLWMRNRNRYRSRCHACRIQDGREYRLQINGTIYVYTNKINGKQYVGQTWRPLERKAQHLFCARTGKEVSAFHNALAKYGEDNFTYKVLEEDIVTQRDMDYWEEHYIQTLNTLKPNGYNLKTGGASGRPSEDVRKRQGYSRCKRPVICIETGKVYKNSKDAEEDTGISFTDITRSARGVVKIVGGYHWAYWHEGFVPSDRHFAPEGNEGKRIICLETGKVFSSVAEAAKSLGKNNPSSIFACLRGRSNYAFGYRWMLYEEYQKNPVDVSGLPSVQGVGKYKPVICVETGAIYANCPDAGKKTGFIAGGIREACSRENHFYRGFRWMYLDKFEAEKEKEGAELH